jgi:predicted RNase H-like HicB family nuclease
MKRLQLTGLLEREGDGYVSLCPELDVASQGSTVEEALANLREAVELFLETASPSEIEQRYHPEVIVSRFEAMYAPIGTSRTYDRKTTEFNPAATPRAPRQSRGPWPR